MREEAAMPAFAQEIEDCDVLIAYFGGNATQSAAASKATPSSVPGAKQLDVRKVEADTSYGQAIKKKGSESAEDSYFAGSSAGEKKGKKQGSKKGKPLALGESPADEDETPAAAARSDLKVPVGHLSALLSLSIPPPTSSADVPRVVENLKLKRRYFVENQDRKTKERIEEVEKRLGKAAIVDGGEEGEKEASA